MARGLPGGLRAALVALLDLVLATPGIDPETERRATWLRWHLIGHDPLAVVDRKLLTSIRCR